MSSESRQTKSEISKIVESCAILFNFRKKQEQIGKASIKKRHKLGLFSQPPLTFPLNSELCTLIRLSIFTVRKNNFICENVQCLTLEFPHLSWAKSLSLLIFFIEDFP